jgi:uncharacterized protein
MPVDDVMMMWELQKVDQVWTKVAKRIQQIQAQLGENEELKAARAQVAQTQADLHSWRGKQTDAELESKSLASRIKAGDEKLMSGQVRDAKELAALQASIEALRRHRELVEEQALTALTEVEALDKQLATEEAALGKLEGKWSSSQDGLRQEELKQKQNYVLLKRKRESLATTMSPGALEKYEHMRKRKAGVAIAEIKNGICSACQVTVPTGVANGLRSGSGLYVPCPSCGRYLVLV